MFGDLYIFIMRRVEAGEPWKT